VTIARFIDHMDGELARQSGKVSPIGAMYDSMTGSACYATMFLGMGYAEWRHRADDWVLWFAVISTILIVMNMLLQTKVENWTGTAPDPYPQVGRFEAEDWFFLIGTIGTVIFTMVSIRELLRDLRKPEGQG
jgi:phosphatidylglycerophosphate synthase